MQEPFRKGSHDSTQQGGSGGAPRPLKAPSTQRCTQEEAEALKDT
jgi:hypothetical protein